MLAESFCGDQLKRAFTLDSSCSFIVRSETLSISAAVALVTGDGSSGKFAA
jgi:hypothetical protein